MFWQRKNKHNHDWKVIRTAIYHSITGPRTILSWKCQTCPKTSDENRRGAWKPEDFN